MDHKETIKKLPDSAGVYIMKGPGDEVLYVGKAANLKKRVSSYFQPRRRASERIAAMVERVEDITYIPTATEAEALIYENSLIKQLSPKYNVALRDDKSYPMLKLTVSEPFPRLFVTRQRKSDGAIYYGPYSNAKLLKEALIALRQIFPMRSCARMPKNPCLNYHIRQCLAPCAGKISDEKYSQVVSELKLFLEGKRSELLRLLTERMTGAARREDFEEAGRIRNRIEGLSSIKERSVLYYPAAEVEELKNVLKLEGGLDVIEAFDVSNIMGAEAVGSMIYFYKGRPVKSEYRKFRIKTVSRIDDYAMMRELILRRYSRLVKEKRQLPGLILIDGGKGHLAVALDELGKLGLSNIPVIGIAKPARLPSQEQWSGGEFEHVYTKESDKPITLPRESKALHLLERIRDEAHRFAIKYHKSLLSRKVQFSELDEIPGIGPKRKKELLSHFGTVDSIRAARIEELLRVKGMNEKSARNIIEHFKE